MIDLFATPAKDGENLPIPGIDFVNRNSLVVALKEDKSLDHIKSLADVSSKGYRWRDELIVHDFTEHRTGFLNFWDTSMMYETDILLYVFTIFLSHTHMLMLMILKHYLNTLIF